MLNNIFFKYMDRFTQQREQRKRTRGSYLREVKAEARLLAENQSSVREPPKVNTRVVSPWMTRKIDESYKPRTHPTNKDPLDYTSFLNLQGEKNIDPLVKYQEKLNEFDEKYAVITDSSPELKYINFWKAPYKEKNKILTSLISIINYLVDIDDIENFRVIYTTSLSTSTVTPFLSRMFGIEIYSINDEKEEDDSRQNILICEIQTADSIESLENQRDLVEKFKPFSALLQFSLPYTGSKTLESYEYYDGKIIYEPFGKADSNVTRLIVTDFTQRKTYNIRSYDRKIFHLNYQIRNNTRWLYYDEKKHFDFCFAANVLRKYNDKFSASISMDDCLSILSKT